MEWIKDTAYKGKGPTEENFAFQLPRPEDRPLNAELMLLLRAWSQGVVDRVAVDPGQMPEKFPALGQQRHEEVETHPDHLFRP